MAASISPAIVAFRKTLKMRLPDFEVRDKLRDDGWSATVIGPTEKLAEVRLHISEFGLRGNVELVATGRLPLGSGARTFWKNKGFRSVRRIKIRRLAAAWAHLIRQHAAMLHAEHVHES